MKTAWPIAIVAWWCVLSPALGAESDYENKVSPIFARHCLQCHGPDTQESGLRLDDRTNLLRGGDYGRPIIVPGRSADSFLIEVISQKNPDLKMPPEGEPLTAKEIQQIAEWIDQGAAMPAGVPDAGNQLWSLQPLSADAPPQVRDDWIRNPIDAFVLTRLREKGLVPSSSADPLALMRRIHLVLHGLPPTVAEVQAHRDRDAAASDPSFVLDQLVDELLHSPRMGERWAQHWLDVIRWAETAGFETNAPRSRAWPYRDWLIRSFNEDKSFARFILEQIAGDTVEEDAALGFLVAGPANLPGQIGRDEESMRQARQDELDESIRTVSQAFLGLTVGCARCHSHKFDPISQRDYYAFQALLSGMRYGQRRWRNEQNAEWTARLPEATERVEQCEQAYQAAQRMYDFLPPIEGSHTEEFPAVEGQAVRMEIRATENGQAASLYEFEIYHPTAPDNLALAARGGRSSASSFALENQTRHPDNLNDGKNDVRQDFPWRAKAAGPAWIEIRLPAPQSLGRVAWQRGYSTPVDFSIMVQLPDGSWQEVANSHRRLPRTDDQRAAKSMTLARSDGTKLSRDEVRGVVQTVQDLRTARNLRTRYSSGPQVFAARFQSPDKTWLLRRGDAMQRLQEVGPAIPVVLGDVGLAVDSEESARRLALATFLGQSPLTARVIANRVWQHHFGRGLVDTPSDFGRMGSPPSHPALLDWLAGELIRHNWSLKHLHRLILNSHTFRQSSAPRQQAVTVDSDTRWLWRFPPQRRDAESLRDSILVASGRINYEMGGPGFDFFNQKGGLSDYLPHESFDPNGWRRMIYATRIRMQAIDIFGAFDCPDSGQMAPKRSRSITPVQAVSLWNSTFVGRQAEFMATRILSDEGDSLQAQVERAFVATLSRSPTPAESARLQTLSREHGLHQVCRVLLNSNEFVFLQ